MVERNERTAGDAGRLERAPRGIRRGALVATIVVAIALAAGAAIGAWWPTPSDPCEVAAARLCVLGEVTDCATVREALAAAAVSDERCEATTRVLEHVPEDMQPALAGLALEDLLVGEALAARARAEIRAMEDDPSSITEARKRAMAAMDVRSCLVIAGELQSPYLRDDVRRALLDVLVRMNDGDDLGREAVPWLIWCGERSRAAPPPA